MGGLSKIEGVNVPEGFCVITDCYKKTIGHNKEFHRLLTQLSPLTVKEKDQISKISGKIRKVIEEGRLHQRSKKR